MLGKIAVMVKVRLPSTNYLRQWDVVGAQKWRNWPRLGGPNIIRWEVTKKCAHYVMKQWIFNTNILYKLSIVQKLNDCIHSITHSVIIDCRIHSQNVPLLSYLATRFCIMMLSAHHSMECSSRFELRRWHTIEVDTLQVVGKLIIDSVSFKYHLVQYKVSLHTN